MKHDMNGDLILPPGMRSEYDDEVRQRPQAPKFNHAKHGLIDHVNSLQWKKAWLPEEYETLDAAVAAILDYLDQLEQDDKIATLASYERARREIEAMIRTLKRNQSAIWKEMGALHEAAKAQDMLI